MKRIYSQIISVIAFPIKLIKKSKIDNFVGGLLIGSLFSLAVNVITNQLQEIIQKQRILEAIEGEIAFNLISAYTTMEINEREKEKDQPIIYYKVLQRYSSNLWSQSSDSLQYAAQLDPGIQAKMHVFFYSTINNSKNPAEFPVTER